MLLIIIGLPCSGKTTAMSFCKESGMETVSSGDIIREEITSRGMPYNEQTDKQIAEWFHDEGRERLLMQKIINKITTDPSVGHVVIDGLRSAEQLALIEAHYGVKPTIVEIKSTFELRLQRCKTRHRFDNETEDYLRSRDTIERSRGLSELLEMADFRFDNIEDLESFHVNFKKFLENVV